MASRRRGGSAQRLACDPFIPRSPRAAAALAGMTSSLFGTLDCLASPVFTCPRAAASARSAPAAVD